MLTILGDIRHTVCVINLQRAEVKVYLSHLFAALVLEHALPVLERAVNERLW